jgi:general nucleoside transport system permease protein
VSRRAVVALAIAGLLVAVASLALVTSSGARDAALAFWRGSLGTPSALFSATLVRAVPLALLGVGLSIAFRAGMFNIGGEGQLILGGIGAALVGLHLGSAGPVALPVALGAAMLGGAAWAAIAGILRAWFGVLEVISTIMLNFVAMNLVSYLVRGPLQEPSRIYPQTELIAEAARLPRLLADTRLHAGVLLVLLASVGGWWFLTRTAAGFRVRTAGASPDAARAAGRVNVARTSILAMTASGALAGLAGGVEVTGVTYALYEHLSPGYGFAAIAVAILARLNPLAVVPSAILFAALESGALGMQRDAGIPSTVAAVLEAVAILVIVAVGGSRVLRLPRFGRRVTEAGA